MAKAMALSAAESQRTASSALPLFAGHFGLSLLVGHALACPGELAPWEEPGGLHAMLAPGQAKGGCRNEYF
jgi:hypothetical protein